MPDTFRITGINTINFPADQGGRIKELPDNFQDEVLRSGLFLELLAEIMVPDQEPGHEALQQAFMLGGALAVSGFALSKEIPESDRVAVVMNLNQGRLKEPAYIDPAQNTAETFEKIATSARQKHGELNPVSIAIYDSFRRSPDGAHRARTMVVGLGTTVHLLDLAWAEVRDQSIAQEVAELTAGVDLEHFDWTQPNAAHPAQDKWV